MSGVQLQTYLRIKELDRGGKERWLVGIASTPRTDRAGDTVTPDGAVYRLPMPLLFGHDHQQIIGTIVEADADASGIRIKARLTEGVDRADEVWTLLQDGVPLALSIGFRSLESEPTNTGTRFTRWDWFEASVCAVPMNPDCLVSIGKSAAYRQASPAAQSSERWREGLERRKAQAGTRNDGLLDSLVASDPDSQRIFAHLKSVGIDPLEPATRAETFLICENIGALAERIKQLEARR